MSLVPLSGLDALFLHLETAEMPMHVGSLSLVQLPPRVDATGFVERVRELIGARLHLAAPFTRRLATPPLDLANPFWAPVHPDDLDLTQHIRLETLPAPGTLADLHACVAALHETRLDRSRPLWELVVIDGLRGAYAGQVGYYAKVHHAAIDGQAGVALARAMLDFTPEPRAVPAREDDWPATVTPTPRELLAATAQHGWRQLRQVPQLTTDAARSARQASGPLWATARRALRDVLGVPSTGSRATSTPAPLLGPRTPLNGAIGSSRAVATLSLPLAQLKALARALDVTLNDLVLTLCAGGLRPWLAAHGGVPAQPLFAAVPFTLRAAHDAAHQNAHETAGSTAMTNRVSMMRAQLATHLADPRARLAAIHASMQRGKALTGSLRDVVPTDYPSLGAPWLLATAAQLTTRTPLADHLPVLANVVISNLPGPPVPLYLAGGLVRHYWPLSIVVHGLALNITVQSYAEHMEFGLVACRRSVPDLDAIVAGLRDAFDELAALVAPATDPAAEAATAAPAPARAPATARAASPRKAARPAAGKASRAAPPAATPGGTRSRTVTPSRKSRPDRTRS